MAINIMDWMIQNQYTLLIKEPFVELFNCSTQKVIRRWKLNDEAILVSQILGDLNRMLPTDKTMSLSLEKVWSKRRTIEGLTSLYNSTAQLSDEQFWQMLDTLLMIGSVVFLMRQKDSENVDRLCTALMNLRFLDTDALEQALDGLAESLIQSSNIELRNIVVPQE